MEIERKIFWTDEAVNWLEKIYKYISLDNPIAASHVVDNIYQKAQILKQYSEIGYIYKNDQDGKIRILLYGHYRIAYLIKPESIDILGVFHGALQIENYI